MVLRAALGRVPEAGFSRQILRQARGGKLGPKLPQAVEAATQLLCAPLRDTVQCYARLERRLPPFESTLVQLTLKHHAERGGQALSAAVGELDAARKAIRASGRELVAQHSPTTRQHRAPMLQAVGTLCSLAEERTNAPLKTLREVYRSLWRLPCVQTCVPSAVLVGCPNVGKSSIVRAVSTGRPVVNNYPFTTRGVSVGHLVLADRETQCQVMDTPGLLQRAPGESRNLMEQLTLRTVELLPSVVVFVVDPTGHAGEQSSLDAQLAVRQELRAAYSDRPWIDVVSKVDLLQVSTSLPSDLRGAVLLSVEENVGVDALMAALSSSLETVAAAMKQEGQREPGSDEDDATVVVGQGPRSV